MAHHRFIGTFDITVALPNANDDPTEPVDDELITNITEALVNKVRMKRKKLTYTVEKVDKVEKKDPPA